MMGVKLFVSDKCLGFFESVADFHPEATWPRCVVHWYRNVWTSVPSEKLKAETAMLKAIHAQKDAMAAKEKGIAVVAKLCEMKLRQAAELVEEGLARKDWKRRSNP